MKVLLLHLSDLHFKNSDRYIPNRAKSIVKAVCSNFEFEEVFVFTTGDIAQSGQKDEYGLAAKFFGTLITDFLSQKNIRAKIMVVPGNHDINFNGKQRNRSDVAEIFNNGISPEILNEEYSKFSEFWKFANFNDCFKDNKEVDCKLVTLKDGTNIQINLINSALFSLYKDELKDGDEGKHFLSPNNLRNIEKKTAEGNSIAITLMHHAEEYFSWDTRNELRAYLKSNTDLLLLGHDHSATSYILESNMNGNLIVVKGGKLNDSSLVEGAFGAYILDTEDGKLTTTQFDWNNQGYIYTKSTTNTYLINSSIKNNDKFNTWLESADNTSISKKISDYFVFPRLTVKQDCEDASNKDKEIIKLEDFKECISSKRLIEIAGDDLSGKTTLIKHLYNDFKRSYIPLIITEEDIAGRIENIIRNAFERQYSYDGVTFEAFVQEPKEKKVILIDDINFIKEKLQKPLLKYLLEKFGMVFYTTNLSAEFNIKKSLEEFFEDAELKLIKLKIEPFYTDKRLELIKNVCKCVQDFSSEQDLEMATKNVNKFIKNQLKVFSLNPEFIIVFTRSFVLRMVENSDTNAFNAVFSNNISVAIERSKIKTNAQDDLIILQEFAAFIHFNKKYPAQIEDLKAIVAEYNQKHRTNLFYLDVKNELENAKVLKSNDNDILFYNRTYLAFFVAKWINRKIQNGSGIKELQEVVDNLCYNINSDILLFLTYITENIGALYQILKSEMDYTSSFKELNIDKNDITLLKEEVKQVGVIKAPTTEDKSLKRKKEIEAEKSLIERQNLEKVNIYDENIDEFTAKQMRLLKYLELISKILPCFYHLLETEQQDAFVSEIYRLPNKIAYFMFEPLESNKEELIRDLKDYLSKNEITKLKDEHDIKLFLSELLTSLLLTLYEISASCCSTDRTIVALDSFDYRQNSSYYVQNIMMHENLRRFEQYVKRSDELFDTTKSSYIKLLLRKIFRKHCLNNNVVYKGDGQKYIDKYLGEQNIVALRLGFNKKE